MASRTVAEEEHSAAKSAIMQTQQKRRGLETRIWLVVSELGNSRLEQVGKHSIMRRTGLPARDLRVLDPLLSYPSTILGRERAIVVNLEHIKAIITAREVILANSTNPLVLQFLQDLKHRLSRSNDTQQQDVHGSDIDVEGADKVDWWSFKGTPPGPKLLPFEFRAIEACLESTCRSLESETRTLEQEAYPALDELTSKISTLNLERVRQIKSRLVQISGRVQKVRDELEHLLDDDNDMAEMYLTKKLVGQSEDQIPSREEQDIISLESDNERAEESAKISENWNSLKPKIEELEMLLEAYFAQLDGILQKLSDMSDYVGDTEDCINIMLDDKQNQLLQMGVMFSTANMIINAGIVVVGIFGMNITISLFSAPTIKFWQTTFGTIGGCVALYFIAIGWGKKKKLLAL